MNQDTLLNICALLIGLTLISDPTVASNCEPMVAHAISVEGLIEVQRQGTTTWAGLAQNDAICLGDVVRVSALARGAIQLSNDTVVRVDQNTTLTFIEPEDENKSWLELLEGIVHVISRDPRALKVVTPFANAGLEGTEFSISVGESQTDVTVLEGAVAFSNESGTTEIGAGETGSASAGQAPTARITAQARNSVQWALYFVPVLNDQLSGTTTQSATPATDTDSYTTLAARELSVGRLEEARANIDEALSLDATNDRALALQSVIAVTLNEPEQALELAQQALKAKDTSDAALIAMSYAHQALFDLPAALQDLEQATAQNPANALAWARRAELELAQGDLDAALASANRSVTLNPNLGLTQTVLGFAYLTQMKVDQAKQAFDAAIVLDQAAPLPHLGSGLAHIREGELKTGRAQIEIAVALDPNQSIIRSYMGKAYYEEKRDELAQTQFTFAKQLDASDPTPWYYDAIMKQTINRPVEALHDLQHSIALNDNRAVYRSRLLLDEDLAARSAAQGRIYNNLNFESLALIEGWKSVNSDPANYSGHRLLADTYATTPRTELARADELFQSQLLQPMNITPVRPQLAETSLFLSSGTFGSATTGFNEFNPLFTQDGLGVEASGVTGNNDTVGYDAVLYGIEDKLSFSLGGYHFETDGFHANNQQDSTVLNAYAQYRPTYKTSLQAELRSTDYESGDPTLYFDPDNFDPDRKEDEDADSVRLGLRHAQNERTDWLVSLAGQNTDRTLTLASAFDGFTDQFNSDQDSWRAELQNLYAGDAWHLTSGVSYLDQDLDLLWIELVEAPPNFQTRTESTRQSEEFIAYSYARLHPWDPLTLILGASYVDLDVDDATKDQLNPKFGVIWEPLTHTTVRLAAFRTQQRSFLSNRTVLPSLEPTQVAGFNQVLFGFNGEDAWSFGAGIDQIINPNLSAGIEYSVRELEVPVGLIGSGDTVDRDETEGRAYLYWTPAAQLALSAEYGYEKFENGSIAGVGTVIGIGRFEAFETHRVPLAINWFHPSGVSASFGGTYVDQSGVFQIAGNGLAPDADNFWVFDAALSYRLPKRYGLLSATANNLFDETFRFQDTDPRNPGIVPERWVLFSLTLSF